MQTNDAIPEELVPVVLEKAGKLYQQQLGQGEDYSLEQLMAAGAEVQLPPELIQTAYEELQREQRQQVLQAERRKQQARTAGAIATLAAVFSAIWIGSTYNALSTARTQSQGQWAQVENQMQRRADLIPQLTQIAQSYASSEQQMSQQLIQQLNQAQAAFVAAETIEQQQLADEACKRAIAQFQTLASRHPSLQSSELFVNLQYEIAGTENRIATERKRYNEAIAQYNQAVQSFPNVIVAGLFGLTPQPYFESQDNSESNRRK